MAVELFSMTRMIQRSDLVDGLLETLDKKAREYNMESGLPLYSAELKALFREVVYKWLIQLREELKKEIEDGS